ncbi:MAG: hypothetical protein E7562_03140 [Ruminococcaceae bacterium]|nr:hypothetical protein [Oscillospiraceae bacterium]
MRRIKLLLSVILIISLLLCGCADEKPQGGKADSDIVTQENILTLDNIPDYDNSPYVILYDNEPQFKSNELTVESFEDYSPLDSLGRCGVVMACIGRDIMPTEERGNIGSVKPSGWVMAKYDFVDGKYLYNRCHLIGFQLTGENANECNLITGTRYLNVDGMLPFENMIADYVEETGNHVLYRVTPVFEGENLVASGVQMEAYSVEDKGESICFNVYAYNVQPGVEINYLTGESKANGNAGNISDSAVGQKYIVNTNSNKFHYPECGSIKDISEQNRKEYTGNRETLLSNGYSPCGNCKP